MSTPPQGNSTGSTSSSTSPVGRSVKAAPCRPCLNTLLCCSGTAGRTSLSFSSGVDPLVWMEGRSCFPFKRAGILGAGGGLGWPEGAVIVELSIKCCLLRPDFASVLIFVGRLASTWTPHLGLCLAQPKAQPAEGGAVAEANGEEYGGGRPGERALSRDSEGQSAGFCS